MKENVLIHIPHSSLYIPDDYKKTSLLLPDELNIENLFMCDYKVNELISNNNQTIIFPYSRLYCDVERFKDDSEIMNKYGMGYIYTKTSEGKDMFNPNDEHRKIVSEIYDKHHHLLDDAVTKILAKYGKCFIIDLHSFSDEQVYRLFNYQDVPDICIGIEERYYSAELTNHFIDYFRKNGYTVAVNYPYKGSLVPNKYYKKADTGIVSIMIEINKRVYENNFDSFKKVLEKSLNF